MFQRDAPRGVTSSSKQFENASMKDLVLGLIFLALGIVVWLQARQFPVVPGMAYGADLFPSITAFGMAAGGALLSLTSLIKLYHNRDASSLRFNAPKLGAVLPVVMVLAYIYLSDVLGAALTMTLIMLSMLIIGGVRWTHAAPISIASAAVISLSFGHVLKVPLPTGPFGF